MMFNELVAFIVLLDVLTVIVAVKGLEWILNK